MNCFYFVFVNYLQVLTIKQRTYKIKILNIIIKNIPHIFCMYEIIIYMLKKENRKKWKKNFVNTNTFSKTYTIFIQVID